MSQLKKHVDKKGNSFPHLYIDEVTGEYWAVIRVDKKIRKRNLKTTSYFEAIGALPTVLADLSNKAQEVGVEQSELPNKLLSDYWEDLLKEKRADDVAESTMIRAKTVWNHHLKDYLGAWTPDRVKPDMLPDFVEWHRKKHKGKQLINVYKYMGNLFRFMTRVGALQLSQVPPISVPKKEKKHHDKKKGRFITEEERLAIKRNCKGTRIRLIVGLADSLGMRKMEIGKLDKERIIHEDGRYFLELTEDDTKTGLPRILPVPREIEPLLIEQMSASSGSEFLFPTKNGLKSIPAPVIDREWKAAKVAAKIKGAMRMHDWRHTRATEMAKQNINPIIACTILGMTVSVYQKRYMQLSGKDLIKTVDEMSAWAQK